MSRFAWFASMCVTLALAVVLIVLSELHSWSSPATTWGLTAIFGTPLAIDFVLLRLRQRSGGRHDGSGRAARPTK
jgi:hypothetical protein